MNLLARCITRRPILSNRIHRHSHDHRFHLIVRKKNYFKDFFLLKNVISIDNHLYFIHLHISLVLKLLLESVEYWESFKNMLLLKGQN